MKAISVRQPWTHAILHLGKRVENRDWAGCAYRGPVLIHASKRLVLKDFDADVERIMDIMGGFSREALTGLVLEGISGKYRPSLSLPFGGIVGRARIVGVVTGPPMTSPRARWRKGTPEKSLWYEGGFALVLADVQPMPFVPWRGQLGLFDVPDSLFAPVQSGAAT